MLGPIGHVGGLFAYLATARRQHASDRTTARQCAWSGSLPPGLTELMVHPGYPDAALAAATAYVAGRERELAALTAEEARAALRRNRVELVSWDAPAPRAPP